MLKSFFKFISKGLKDLSSDSSFSSLTGGGQSGSLSSGSSDAQLIANNKNWVYVCTDKIAMTMSGIELHLYKYDQKGKETEIYDSPVLDLMYKPNKLMTGRDFLYIITGHLELVGNAYLLKDQPQNPKQLFPLNPSGIRAVYNKNRTDILSYKYTVDGASFDYPVEQIIHIKYPSMKNPFKGTGTLENIAEWVDVDNAATEFNRLFFQNGASPSGILETEATDERAMLLAKTGFEMRYQGTMNAHKTAVLGKGSKYTATSASPRDMQFSEMDTRFRDKILAGFGVPKSVVGIVDDVNRANAEASYFVFLLFTIDPKMKCFVAYLNEYLLPSFTGTEKMYFKYDDIIPENEDLQIRENVASLAGQSWRTINEVRSEEGLPPIENGDFVYGGFSTIPIGKPTEQLQNNMENVDTKAMIKTIKSSRMKTAVKKDEVVDDIIEKIFKNGILEKTQAELDEAVHKAFITRVSQYENKFIKVVKQFDDKIQEQVLENLTEEGKSFYNAKDLFDASQAQKLFIGLTSPLLQDLIKTEGQAQMDRLDTTEPFNPMNEGVQERLKKVLHLTSQSYTDTTLKLLSSQLQEGVSAGESLPELRERVAQVFGLTEKYRAERVARTTVFSVANQSARDAYKQSGVVTTVKWHTAEDEKVCEFCGPLDGKIIGVDESFFELGDIVRGSDGGIIKIDFNNVEDPPLHANCRCFTNAEAISVQRNANVATHKSVDLETEAMKEIINEL